MAMVVGNSRVKFPYFESLKEGENYRLPVLCNCLKERNITPHSRWGIIRLEKRGILPPPRRTPLGAVRLYYKSEIAEIIKILEGRK